VVVGPEKKMKKYFNGILFKIGVLFCNEMRMRKKED
jgi:hypothetical protein